MPAPKSKHAKPGRPKDGELAARRRGEIVQHAIDEFARHGYSAADLDVVARNAGCSKGTLYNYFASKGELFSASVDHVMFSMPKPALADDAGDVTEDIEQLVVGFLEHFAKHPQYVELLVQERSDFRDRKDPTYYRYRQQSRARWLRRFEGWIDQGRMRPMPPERAIDFLGNLLYGTIFLNHFRGRRIDPARQARELLDVLFGGLLTPSADADRAKTRRHVRADK